MRIKIQKNIPIPLPRKKTGVTDALRKLKVGESFFIDRTGKGVSPSIQIVKLQTGRKFTTREEEGGVRIWRTE